MRRCSQGFTPDERANRKQSLAHSNLRTDCSGDKFPCRCHEERDLLLWCLGAAPVRTHLRTVPVAIFSFRLSSLLRVLSALSRCHGQTTDERSRRRLSEEVEPERSYERRVVAK